MSTADYRAQRSVSSGSEPSSIMALYDHYGTCAFTLAARMLADGDAAAAMVEAVFLDLWRRVQAGASPGETARQWLLTEVHLRCVAALRGRPRAPEPPIDGATLEAGSAVTGGVPDPDPHALQCRLAELPADLRAILEMSYFHAQTGAQIASQRQVPRAVVYRQLRQALEELRRPSSDESRVAP